MTYGAWLQESKHRRDTKPLCLGRSAYSQPVVFHPLKEEITRSDSRKNLPVTRRGSTDILSPGQFWVKHCPCLGQQFESERGVLANLLQNPPKSPTGPMGAGEALGQQPWG